MSASSTVPTAATPDVCTTAILLDGQALSGRYHVLSLTVVRELNRIPYATIHIKDGDASRQRFDASDTELFAPGRKIEIQLGYRSKNEAVFKGLVVRQGLKARRTGTLLVVECKDASVKLTHGSKSACFTDQKDSDVLEQIIGSHGLTADVEATKVAAKALVQFDSTDWDFLVCRAEANGQVVDAFGGTVSVKAPDAQQKPPLSVAFGSTLLEFDVEMDARVQDESLAAKAWSAADQALSESQAAEASGTGNGNIDAATLAGVLAGGTQILRHGGALSEPELQAWADARMLKERFARIRGRALFQGFAALVPGSVLEVDGIGQRFAGKFYVSGVRHSVSQGNWQTDAQLGLDPEPFARSFGVNALRAGGLLPAVHGLQIGVVTALAGDPEGEPRIRVRLPIVSDGDEGVWTRLATLDAGKERGTWFRPEIDDEVIVGFIDDDPRHGVVLGMLHSSARATPEPISDANAKKGYTSREKLRLVFDDGQKLILLETPAGNSLTLTEADSGITLKDQNGNKLSLSADGIKLESVKDITLKATAGVKVDGVDVQLSATSGLKASGSGTAEFKGASTTVDGSGMLTLSGGLVKIN